MTLFLRKHWLMFVIAALLLLLAVGWLVYSMQETEELPLRGVYVLHYPCRLK